MDTTCSNEATERTSDITVLKISPQAGSATFLSKADMKQLFVSRPVSEEMKMSQSLNFSNDKQSSTIPVYLSEGTGTQTSKKSSSSSRIKPNILSSNRKKPKRKSYPDSDMLQLKNKHQKRKSEIVPLPLPEPLVVKKEMGVSEIITIPDDEEDIIPKRKLSKRKQKPENNNICSFCQLGSDAVHGIGQLYGPYKISAHEILDKIKHHRRKNEYKIEVNSNTSDDAPVIILDGDNEDCRIRCPGNTKSALFKAREETTIGDLNSLIEQNSCDLQMHQAIDQLLTDRTNPSFAQRIKRLNPVSLDDDVRIPGLKNTCKVKNKRKSDKDDILPKLKTIKMNSFDSTDSENEANTLTIDIQEIWVHGFCALHAPGVYALADRLYGLQEALNNFKAVFCALCRKPGATIQNGIKSSFYHYPCAIKKNIPITDYS